MCWEIAIPAAASAAGAYINSSESQSQADKAAAARNEVLIDTLNKNATLADAARGEFNTRMDNVQPDAVATQQADLTGDRTETILSTMPGTETVLPGAANTSEQVKSAMLEALDTAVANSTARSTALGQLGGYGDLFQSMDLANAQAGRDIGTNVNFAKANLALLPSLQDFAEYEVYQPTSGIGSVLQGLGSAFASYAGSQT